MKNLLRYQYLGALLMAVVTLEAKQSPKIVGLLQVRNEELYIEQCLRALSYYTDAMVVLDDGSQDATVSVVQSLAQELHIERIIRNATSAWQAHDERYNRQRLLEEGRAIKGTHFIFIDTDEMFSAECAKDNWLRKQILAMQKGQMLRMPELNLWGSTQYYRDDDLYSPVTTNWARKPFAFCDDGQSHYHENKSWCLSGIIHISVEPANRKVARHTPHTIYLTDINRCALHFKFVNLDNVETSRVWYMCLEFIRMHKNNKKLETLKEIAQKLNKFYRTTEFVGIRPEERKAVKLSKCRDSWFAGYPFFDPSLYTVYRPQKQLEVLSWLKKYGTDYFKDLDIWHLDWIRDIKDVQ